VLEQGNLSIDRVAELVAVNRATIERLLIRRELGSPKWAVAD
jgi:predicted HTH domain antitoxin